LRFFTDHCVTISMTQTFRDAGYEALRLTDHTSADSIDSVVISKAQELDSILISLNGDFADIAAYPPANYNGHPSSWRISGTHPAACGNTKRLIISPP
jgi:predicted nuclease of predicted toxin-antitoxin system